MRRGLRDHDANLAYERGVARDRICVAIAIGRGVRNESELAESLVRALRAPNAAPNRAATVSAMRRTVPVAGDADDRDILTRRRRVAVAVLVCSIAVSACSSSGPAPVTPPTEATAPAAPVSSQVTSPPVTPSPTLALATPSPLASGTLTTYAGSHSGLGDGGRATAPRLDAPEGVALDSARSLYIADSTNNSIRKVSPGGTISTYAGSGPPPPCCSGGGFSGDGGPATAAQLNAPVGVALDPAGNLYIADRDNQRIRRITSGGTISTYAGTGTQPSSVCGAIVVGGFSVDA